VLLNGAAVGQSGQCMGLDGFGEEPADLLFDTGDQSGKVV
jgi:hypothetical protein